MAESRLHVVGLTLLFSTYFFQVLSSPVNIPLQSVPSLLIQTVLNSLNDDSPTHHTYKGGNLISAQKLVEPPYVTYKLTFNLEPICKETLESCPQEACTIDVKQHELGQINVLKNSIQCMYLYPQSADLSQVQDDVQETDIQEQEPIENLDKQILQNHSVELDHEVQATRDENEKPFIAVRATSSYCPGCPYELNPNLPGLLVYGEQAVESIDKRLPNDFKHKLIQVIKVTRAVRPSSNVIRYEILFEIGETVCLKSAVVERSQCPLQSDLQSKFCLVTFEQPWQQNNCKITKNNCTLSQGIINESRTTIRPSLESDSLTITKSNNNEQEEINNAYENLKDLVVIDNLTKNPAPEEHEKPTVTEDPFVKVLLNKSDDEEKSRGFTDKTREFNEFLEDFDLPIRRENENHDTTHTPVIEESFSKRVVPVDSKFGKSHYKNNIANENELVFSEDKKNNDVFYRRKRSYDNDVDAERNLINELSQMAVDMLDNMDIDNEKRVILDIVESNKQSDSNGATYYLTLKVLFTKCDEKAKNIKDCKEKVSEAAKHCKIQVHLGNDEPLYRAKVMHAVCYDESNKDTRSSRKTRQLRRQPALLGAPSAKDVNDPEIRRYAQIGLNKFSENLEYVPILVEITEATVQVVAGQLYKIKLRLGASDCTKGSNENCQLKSDSNIKECLVSVLSQPWIDHGSPNVDINCDLGKSKRSLRGRHYGARMLAQAEYMKHEKMFEQYIRDFNRKYESPEEKQRRFNIFRNNLEIIDELQRNEQGTATYGVTMFADLALEEFRAKYLGLRPELKMENAIPYPQAEIPDISLPESFDWREHNVVTPVKDQGGCGSCWAFSVTGNIEGQYAIKHGQLLSFSEQELIDCDKLDNGCEGGLPDSAYRALENLGGLELESDYPYDAEDEKCHFKKNKVRTEVISAVNITSNETQMAQWLVQNGPISIGINANAMQFYMGGISHPLKFLCNPENLDHGVLIVGYGIHRYSLFKRVLPFWIIKNSWGPRWGEQGYYRVYRGDGTCGVNAMATSAVVA